ncbi:MAG: type I-B CRISPR-associated protein Cas5b [Bacteroidales bacterium]|nr:type I-B CRISPR-associated protein Cas5b [Bacteroidales bacterium]MCF8337677.1 type I-B CRISPR-associated protein Cas5b [Bacteroidales bacterium]
MRLIRIKGYQPFACYRKPFSYGYWDTFPLPPFSTILGWVHWVIGESEKKQKLPMNIAVTGKFDTITYDLQTLKKFDRIRKNKEQIIIEEFSKALSNSPTYVANITNIFLRIYIHMEDEYMDRFINNVYYVNYPSLGRYEDLLRIDEIKYIEPEIEHIQENGFSIEYGIYLKPETAQLSGIKGSNFNIPFYHQLVNDLRFFEKEKVVYVDSGLLDPIDEDLDIAVDKETDSIFTKPVLIELFGKYITTKDEVLR